MKKAIDLLRARWFTFWAIMSIRMFRRLGKYHYDGNRDIGTVWRLIKTVYAVSGRKPITAIVGVLVKDGPGSQYLSLNAPPDKQLALNLLKEMERQIRGNTLCARDGAPMK